VTRTVEPTPAGRRVRAAADALFYERGIRAVGVAEIAQFSGVAKPNLYRNFESKDGLVVAYLDDHSVADLDVVAAARDAHPDDPREQLRFVVATAAQEMRAPGYRGCPLANAAVEYPDREHPIRVRVDEHKSAFLQSLVAIAAQTTADSAEEVALALVMLMDGAGSSAQLFPGTAAADVLLTAADAVLDAYLGS
jgi:AcrR family transcriptional regulator